MVARVITASVDEMVVDEMLRAEVRSLEENIAALTIITGYFAALTRFGSPPARVAFHWDSAHKGDRPPLPTRHTAPHLFNPETGKRMTRCSVCGKLGHNKRTCPAVKSTDKPARPVWGKGTPIARSTDNPATPPPASSMP